MNSEDSTGIQKRCGLQSEHQPHWWGVDVDQTNWCDGKVYVKTKESS